MSADIVSLVILGAGGTSVDILDFVEDINALSPRYRVLGLLDDDPGKRDTTVEGVPVLGGLQDASRFPEARFVSGLGSPGSYRRLAGILGRTGVPPERFETIVHPSAWVSRRSSIGSGVVVYPNCVVGANARVGNQVIVLANSVINHESTVGDRTIIASNVSISGRVRIGPGCYLGTACAVRQDLVVGQGSLVAMGATVVRDVPPETVVAGSPARVLRRAPEGG